MSHFHDFFTPLPLAKPNTMFNKRSLLPKWEACLNLVPGRVIVLEMRMRSLGFAAMLYCGIDFYDRFLWGVIDPTAAFCLPGAFSSLIVHRSFCCDKAPSMPTSCRGYANRHKPHMKATAAARVKSTFNICPLPVPSSPANSLILHGLCYALLISFLSVCSALYFLPPLLLLCCITPPPPQGQLCLPQTRSKTTRQ